MPTTRARAHHLASIPAVAVITLLGGTLSACGSTDDPDGGTTSSSGPSGQPSASSADPQAGWQTAADDGGQFLVPPDWSVEEVETGHDLQAPPESDNGGRRVGAGIFTSRPTLDSATAIDDSAKSGVSYFKGGGYDKVERLSDESFGGVTFYHVRAEDTETWLDSYGTVVDGQKVTVLWNFNRSMVDRKESDELINQVMPTFKPAS